MTDERVRAAAERAHREHWGRLLALLARHLRSLDIAEDALAEAFGTALRTWPRDGIPDRPEAWLLTSARRRGIDMLRREARLARALPLLVNDGSAGADGSAGIDGSGGSDLAWPADDDAAFPDERLRLLFTCCHPALSPEARVALTLRCVGGLSTVEVARAFLVSESTMAARITRAKKKIAAAGIPYRVPAPAQLPERLPAVLSVLYLIFTEGYSATTGAEPIRRELCAEALRLTRVLLSLLPDEPDPAALLALMALQHSRRDARHDHAGDVVLLPDQNRGRWHHDEIDEALDLLRRAGETADRRDHAASSYRLQAAIAAEHARARRAEDTDWPAIADLYARLEMLTGSPVVRLNRAVAVAEVHGPGAGLALVADLDEALPRTHLLPATRADLLRRLGRTTQARTEYTRAIALAGNAADRAFLTRRRAELPNR